jgi:hypothetical protein
MVTKHLASKQSCVAKSGGRAHVVFHDDEGPGRVGALLPEEVVAREAALFAEGQFLPEKAPCLGTIIATGAGAEGAIHRIEKGIV